MKKISLFLLAYLTIGSFSFSQQLIPDPGFENWNGTSGNFLGPCFDWYENTALPWPASNMGSPDHHHEANPVGSNLTSADPTCTLTGSNFSGCGGVYAGQGCLGVWTEANATFDGTREVAGTQLTQPMTIGECYKVSFWVQSKNNSQTGFHSYISGQGVMFSMTQYPTYDPSTVDYNTLSNSYVSTDSIIRDTIWHYIEMVFTADQAYTHAFIGIMGNWTDINMDVWTLGNSVGPYYWFDEVKVEQMASCCETAFNSQTTTDASCGMTDGSMTVVPVGAGPYTYQLFTYPGNTLVTSNSTGDFQNIAAGDYYITIFDAHCSFNSDTLTVGQTGTPTYGLSGTNPTTCGGADGEIEISNLVNGTNYDIYYDDPGGATVGPINVTGDATGITTITGLIQGDYTNITIGFSGCNADLGNQQLFDPSGVTLNVTLNPIVQCGDIPEIVLSGLVPGETYDWSFDTGYSGNGTVADPAGEIVVVVVPGSYDNFSATLLSSSCTAINNSTIDVLDVTPVNATATPTSAGNCIDDGNVSFQGLEPGLTFNVYWPGGDSLLAVSSGSGVINLPFPVGTWGDFIVQNSTTLCTDTIPAVDIVNPIDPNDSINTLYGIDETCFGANDGEIFMFDFGFLIYDIYVDSVLMSAANTTNLAPGTYEVVKHNTITDCFVVYYITINPGPLCCNIGLIATTDIQPTCGGADGQVTLSDTSALGSTQYGVDGGPLQASPVFTGLTSGIHQFVVVDSAGCQDTLDYDLVPLGAPAAPVAGTDATYCDGDALTDLTATIAGGGTITWYDDLALTNQVGTGATFTPPNTIGVTTYYATETVTGCESSGSPVVVTINSTPLAPAAGTDATYCMGDVISDLTTTATSPNWYDDAGLTNNIGTASTLTPNIAIGATTYYVTETVNGCESPAATVQITINDVPTINSEVSTDLTSCTTINGSVTITSTGTDYELFDASNASIAINTTGVFNGLGAGDYYVVVSNGNCTATGTTLTITDQTSTSSNTINNTICSGEDYTYVDGTISTNITANESHTSVLVNSQGCDSTIIENLTVIQSVTVVVDTAVCSGTDYTFADGSNHVNILQDQTHTSTLVSTNGCDSIVIENVTVTPLAELDLGFDFSACFGETVTVTATSNAGIPIWNNGDSVMSVTFVATTDTILYAAVTGACGSAVDSINITVLPPPNIDAGPDVTIPLGGTTQLEVTSTSTGMTYVWNPANYLDCSDCADPIASPVETTTFLVTGTDENGCVNSDTVTVILDGEIQVFIPNVFSPNGDGQNDTHKVFGPSWSKYSMQVYNRWGGLVFESEDPDIEWSGLNKKGEDCPQAVFVYKFRGTSIVGQIVEKTGNVMLAR